MFFFFKQKTAYEMRISDWSSDVCSSDLHGVAPRCQRCVVVSSGPRKMKINENSIRAITIRSEERRVGKECVVRVDLGGRRIIKKKKKLYIIENTRNKQTRHTYIIVIQIPRKRYK